jgi:hypothetical protein
MRGCAIIPTMRPEMLDNILANISRNNYITIIVRNGRALYTNYPGVVINGPQNKSQCIHLGILEAQKLGCDWYAIFDDDDWYGPQYLHQVSEAFENGARWVGRPKHFVRTKSNRLYIIGNDDMAPLGCTIAARTDLLSWDGIETRMGEERDWIVRVGLEGYVKLTPLQFVRNRHGEPRDHVWPLLDEALPYVFADVLDLGPWNESIPLGDVCIPGGVPVIWKGGKVLDANEMRARKDLGVPTRYEEV